MTQKVLVFCHGWGFSPEYWSPLLPFFNDCTTYLWDLGYFAKPSFPPAEINEDVVLFAVGHSLGFAKLLLSSLPFKGYIGLHPFLKFNKKREAPALKKTILAAKNDLFETLKHFYTRCGLEICLKALNEKRALLNSERLMEDLLLLEHLDLEDRFRKKAPSCKIFVSLNDPIVSRCSIEQDFLALPHVQLTFTSEAKHNLGVHLAKWTSDEIRKFIQL